MKYRKQTRKVYIDTAIEISLEEALKEIVGFPTEDDDAGSFIGFEIKDEFIQFIRLSENKWIIDIRSEIARSREKSILKTHQVKEVLTAFSEGQDWRKIYQTHFEFDDLLVKEEEFRNEIKCEKCGTNIYEAERTHIAQITLKCSKCGVSYSLDINVSEETSDPVITFTRVFQAADYLFYNFRRARASKLVDRSRASGN